MPTMQNQNEEIEAAPEDEIVNLEEDADSRHDSAV